MPDIALSERLGQEGIRLQQLARGCISRSLVPVEPPLVFEEAIELEYPLVLLEPLAFLLSRLLEQLCARLGARALATQEVRLDLTLEQTREPHVGRAPPPVLVERKLDRFSTALCAYLFPCSIPKFFSSCCSLI